MPECKYANRRTDKSRDISIPMGFSFLTFLDLEMVTKLVFKAIQLQSMFQIVAKMISIARANNIS